MSGVKVKSHQLLKSINQQKVLYLIYTEGPISRVELAEKTGLTQQTVTNIVNRLLEEKMVLEGTPMTSSAGRKPVPLTTNSSYMFALGIEVAGKYISGSLCNFRQEPIGRTYRDVEKYESEEHLLTVIRSVIDELMTDLPDKSQIKGVGMSVQGLVDTKRGFALRLPGLGWGNFPLLERMEDAYGLPFYFENDVNLLALNENMNGVLSGSDHNITLKFGYGIGGAIVVGKKLVTGSTFVAGEFGHYKAFSGEDAYKCHCGVSGCLTTLASASGIFRNEGLTLEEFSSRVRARDRQAVRLFRTIVSAIELAVSNVVTFLNPDHLMITGSVMELFGDLLMPDLKRHVLENIPETCRGVKIIHLPHPPAETTLAAGLVIRKVFEIPVESLSL